MDKLQELLQRIKALEIRRIGRNDIIPGSIQQSHLSANTALIIFDKAANRPTQGNNFYLCFFSTDTHVLSIWDNKQWRTMTLT